MPRYKNIVELFKIIGFWGAILLFPFNLLEIGYWIFLALFIFGATFQSIVKNPFTSIKTALWQTLSVFAAGALIYFISRFSPQLAEQPGSNILTGFFKSAVAFLIVPMPITFAFFIVYSDFKSDIILEKNFTLQKLFMILFMLLFLFFIFSSFSGIAPAASLLLFGKQIGVGLLVSLILWKEAERIGDIRRVIVALACLTIFISLLCLACLFTYKFGSDTVKEIFLRQGWIKASEYSLMQFPMKDNHSLASFLMLGSLSCLFSIIILTPGKLRVFIFFFTIFPIIALMLCLQGKIAGIFIIVFFIYLGLTRAVKTLLFPVILISIFALLPSSSKDKISSNFRYENLSANKQAAKEAADAACSLSGLIIKHPFLGWGYGLPEMQASQNLTAMLNELPDFIKQNAFLRIALESGIAAFIVFIIFIINIISSLIQRQTDLRHLDRTTMYSIGFMILITATVLLGFCSDIFHDKIGFFIYVIFGIILAFFKITERIAEKTDDRLRPI